MNVYSAITTTIKHATAFAKQTQGGREPRSAIEIRVRTGISVFPGFAGRV